MSQMKCIRCGGVGEVRVVAHNGTPFIKASLCDACWGQSVEELGTLRARYAALREAGVPELQADRYMVGVIRQYADQVN